MLTSLWAVLDFLKIAVMETLSNRAKWFQGVFRELGDLFYCGDPVQQFGMSFMSFVSFVFPIPP